MVDAPEFHELTTALEPEGDPYPLSDVVKSLAVVSMHHWHPLVGVADAPRPQILPVRLPFLSFSLPRKGEFFSLDRISLKSMTKLSHETVGSRSVSVSSAADL